MKKIMIAVAAVAMSIAANAASYAWGYEGYLNNGDGSYGAIDDTVAYLINAGVTSQSDLLAAFVAGTLDLEAVSVSSSDATFDGIAWTDTFDYTGATDNWEAYFAIVQNDKVFISEAITAEYADFGDSYIAFGTAGDDPDTASNATFGSSDSYQGAGWYSAAAVPEPTSGLLLLIGMAGLALRRRRA